jgi:hypothetical protein
MVQASARLQDEPDIDSVIQGALSDDEIPAEIEEDSLIMKPHEDEAHTDINFLSD